MTPHPGGSSAASLSSSPTHSPSPESPTPAARTASPVALGAARWTEVAAIDAHDVWGLINFDGGYIAYGATEPDLLPGAWFSADGRSWTLMELAEMIPCADSRSTPGAYVVDGASNGREVMLVGAEWPRGSRPCGESRPAAWITSDGESWQQSEPFGRPRGPYGEAQDIWVIPGGWEAAIQPGDLSAVLWRSSDGRAWRDLDTAFYPDEGQVFEAGAASPFGTRLIALRDELLASDEGRSWYAIARPAGDGWTVERILPPSPSGLDPWVVVATRNGDEAVTWTSFDLEFWKEQSFPMPAIAAVDRTRYGLLATGFVSCLDTGGSCSPGEWTQYVSDDGLEWVRVKSAVAAAHLADGPGGVIAIGHRDDDPNRLTVWRLDP